MTELRSLVVEMEDGEVTASLCRLATRAGRVLLRQGLGIYGLGEATRIPLPKGLRHPLGVSEVSRQLSAISPAGGSARTSAGSDPPALLPLAVGALPFHPDAPAHLVVPQVTIVVTAAAPAIAVVVGPDPSTGDLDRLVRGELGGSGHSGRAAAEAERERPPDDFVLSSSRSHLDFLELVRAAIAEIATGRLDKVVLAREVLVRANRPMLAGDLVERLSVLYPSCAVFSVEGFVGASPELLVSRRGADIASHPLAGTAPRSGDGATDRRLDAALMSSGKELAEHRAVVEAVRAALTGAVAELTVPEHPGIVELRNVSHLGTRITGRLDPRRPMSALELLALVHPSPAVAGTPVEAAIEYIAKVEGLERDRYAGAVGWADAAGDGEWFLGIRSGVISPGGTSMRLFAGSGVVADSDPETELAETQLKLQAMLAAAVRP